MEYQKGNSVISAKSIFFIGFGVMLLGMLNAYWQHKWWLLPQAVIVFLMPYLPQLFGSSYEAFRLMYDTRSHLKDYKPLGEHDYRDESKKDKDLLFYCEERTTLVRVTVCDGIYEAISFANLGKGTSYYHAHMDNVVRFSLKGTPFLVQLYLRDVVNYFLSKEHIFPIGITTNDFMDNLCNRAIRTHKINTMLE